MRFIKKAFIKLIHGLGYDISRRQETTSHDLSILKSLNIKTVIDVGANRGQFAKKAIGAFPSAKLYCFEPLEEPYRELEKWSRSFADGSASPPQDRIKLFKVALGDEEREMEIFLHKNHNDSSSLLKTTDLSYKLYPKTKQQKKIAIHQTTLDNALEGLALKPETLIKMDVQGYEDRVILGGKKVIRLAKACILEVCLDKLYKDQANFKKILLLMDELGFKYAGNLDQARAPDGHIIYIDAFFLKE